MNLRTGHGVHLIGLALTALLLFASVAETADFIGDVNGDGQVGLDDAIHALQIVAGHRTQTPINPNAVHVASTGGLGASGGPVSGSLAFAMGPGGMGGNGGVGGHSLGNRGQAGQAGVVAQVQSIP